MKYFFYSALIFFLFQSHNIAKSNDKEILEGLDDIYNLKFDDAEKKFKAAQLTSPNNLIGGFYESMLYFYKALPSRNNEYYEKFLELSDALIDKSENILDKNEKDYDALYYKGLAHSYRSLLMLTMNKNLLQAASNGNDGYRILSALVEEKPDYYDAYMGLGLYKIAIGFVPEKFQWLLSLMGFEGNINDGIRLLKISAASGKFTRTDSKVLLSIFSLREREDDNNISLNYGKELTEEYPNSAVFKILYSGLLLQNGNIEQAIFFSNEALSINNNSFQQEIKKASAAILGTSYFRLNDFKKATEYYDEFIKYIVPEDRTNVHVFTDGISYELTGDREKAVSLYKKVRGEFINERDGEVDKFFYRYAQEKIQNPVSSYDSMMIVAMNLRESNNFDEADKLYKEIAAKKIVSQKSSDDDNIRYYYNLGLTYSYKKDFDNAISCFEKCLTYNPETEAWIVPHSYFELGKIYDKKGNKQKSSQMFSKIFDYDDFDFESFLEMRLSNYNAK